jgi:hypothetical protein
MKTESTVVRDKEKIFNCFDVSKELQTESSIQKELL